MTGTTEMKKKKGERRWNRWTDKKLGELFQIVCLLELRVKGAVRVYWLREEKI